MRFLFVDKIIQSSPGEWIEGIKTITEDSFYLNRTENGFYFFYPALIGEALGQLAAWNVMALRHFSVRPVAGLVRRTSFTRSAFVGETLRLEAFIDSLDEESVRYHGHVHIGEELIFTLEEAVGPLLPMELFIDEATVRQQYQTIEANNHEFVITQTAHAPSSSATPLSTPTIDSLRFDRQLAFEKEHFITAEKRIVKTAAYFADHFPKKPVLPMTMLLESVFLLARDFMVLSAWGETCVVECRKIKMNAFITPGALLQCSLRVKTSTAEATVLTVRCEVDGMRVALLELVMKKGDKDA